MKKISFIILLLALSFSAFAIPARPGWIQMEQPDGSVIEVRLVGDEFGHCYVDRSGQVLERFADGFLRPASVTKAAQKNRMAAARRQEANQRRMREKAPATVQGSPHIPVLLVEFQDVKFHVSSNLDSSVPAYDSNVKTAFSNLLHQSGYSYNGATGSVLDFYTDNSNGVYTPSFDVLDIVTLSGNMADYGANDEETEDDVAPEVAVYEAVKQLNASVDFSQYDNDGDGYIDMILMYYAGFNEAEHGPEDSIWPHQWSVQRSSATDGDTKIKNVRFDGVKLRNYFCTSELKLTRRTYSGLTGVLCGIGTTCHEFAHSLGLPDFYDTDYEGNGMAGGTYNYDTMCGGAYNGNGNTPPFFGAEELMMLGWMEELTELPVIGNVTIPALSKTSKVAYKGLSSTSGEYFVFECRGSSSWDAAIDEGPGLIVYHVDKSSRKVFTESGHTYTAYELWNNWAATNYVNGYGSHPCYYIIPAGCQNYKADTQDTGGYSGHPSTTTGLHYSGDDFVFGTMDNYREYTPVDWNQTTMDYKLSNISYSAGSASFSVIKDMCYIQAPASTAVGTNMPLKLVNAPKNSSVKWFLDDVELSGGSLSLPAGHHLLEARITAGKITTRLELELNVE